MVSLESSHYIIFLLISGTLPIFLGFYLRKREVSTRVKLFEAVMASASFWSFAYLLQVLSVWPSPAFWLKFKYMGIVVLPVAWLSFALEYVGKKKWVSRRNVFVLSLIPILTLVSAWTNNMHHFFWKETITEYLGPFLTTDGVPGFLFWLHSAYSYTLLIGGSLLILWNLAKSERIYFKQALILSIGILVPLIGNVGYLAGFISSNNFDITPLLFPFTIVAFTWALSQYGFMDLVPIARGIVFDRIKDSIFVLDDENKILSANTSAKNITADYFSFSQSDDLIGKQVEEIFSNEPELVDNLKLENEARIEIKVGDDGRNFDVKIDTIKDDSERLIGRVLLFRDITELEELKENEFLHSILRHDLRDRLQVSQGYHQLLQETELTENQKELLEKDMRAVNRGVNLIEKIKKIVSAGKRMEKRPIEIDVVWKEVIKDYKRMAEEKETEIEFEETQLKAEADFLLYDLFSQLLSNSLKHSAGDRVKISGKETDGEVISKIEDNGKGVPEDIEDRIFDRGFKKGETSGSGLGLYLVKRIAENYNGSVEVRDSDLGGVRFDVHLKKA